MSKWISVKESLPEDGNYVLLSDGVQVTLGWYSKPRFRQCNTWHDLSDVVTHWMELPELPNE